MADIILRVVQGHGFERGDASKEFITVLAIGKIRLHKEVGERLRNNIKIASVSLQNVVEQAFRHPAILLPELRRQFHPKPHCQRGRGR